MKKLVKTKKSYLNNVTLYNDDAPGAFAILFGALGEGGVCNPWPV